MESNNPTSTNILVVPESQPPSTEILDQQFSSMEQQQSIVMAMADTRLDSQQIIPETASIGLDRPPIIMSTTTTTTIEPPQETSIQQIVETAPMITEESVVISSQFDQTYSDSVTIPSQQIGVSAEPIIQQIVETPMVAESVVVSTTNESPPSAYQAQTDAAVQSILSHTPITVQVSGSTLETTGQQPTMLTTPTTTTVGTNIPGAGVTEIQMQPTTNRPVPATINQLQPIKLSGGSHSFLMANPVIGGNSLPAGFSYILPGNSFGVGNKQPTMIPISDINTATLINSNSSSEMPDVQKNIPGSGLKLVHPSNQSPRHLVFSPMKSSSSPITTTITPVAENQQQDSSSLTTEISLATTKNQSIYSGPTTATIMQPASTAGSSQPQQSLLILSPMKTTTSINQTGKPGNASAPAGATFLPSFKLVSGPKMPTLTSSPSKRIAPAPPPQMSTSVATSKMQTNVAKSGIQYISLVPMSNEINAAIKTASGATTTIGSKSKPKINPVGTIKPSMVQILKLEDATGTSATSKQIGKFVPIAPNPSHAKAVTLPDGTKVTESTGKNKSESNPAFEENRRKGCNCTRSQCLKLYCDCFANGEFCKNCNCLRCFNNLEHEEVRQKAIRSCLDRNPNAFHPKIGQGRSGNIERRHNKGCCCKRSNCLKNYCECYEAKIQCSQKCKCVGCRNVEENPRVIERNVLTRNETVPSPHLDLPMRPPPPSVVAKMNLWGPDIKPKLPVKVKSDCPPFNLLTNEILEATACCLLAQAEEGEFENLSEENVEGLILDQFGECLSQILNLANNGISEDFEISENDDDIGSTENDQK